MAALPPLSNVTKKVAHDVRGPLGVIAAALHEIELSVNEEGSDDASAALARLRTDLPRLLEMARRGTRKLERLAITMDAVGALEAPALSSVDLLPMVKTAIERMQTAERRPQVKVVVDEPAQTVRVRVSPQLFTHALEELFGHAIRRCAAEVRVDFVDSTVRITLVGVDAVPAMVVPFQDTLGLAAHLLDVQHVSLTTDHNDAGVTLVVAVPAP